MDALVELIADIKAAQQAGADAAASTAPARFQRRGQFYVDFVESENSNGFHAPQEAARILGEAIDQFRKGQVSLRPPARRGRRPPRPDRRSLPGAHRCRPTGGRRGRRFASGRETGLDPRGEQSGRDRKHDRSDEDPD